MKALLIAVFTLLTASCGTLAPAQVGGSDEIMTLELGDGSIAVILPPATVQRCIKQGGCATLSQDYLEALIAHRCKQPQVEVKL